MTEAQKAEAYDALLRLLKALGEEDPVLVMQTLVLIDRACAEVR